MSIRVFAVALCLAVLTGCSSANLDPFLGTWTVTGNANLVAGGMSSNTSGSPAQSTYNVVISKGTTSDLISLDNHGCQLQWSVSGNTATLAANSTCTVQTDGSSSVVIVEMSGSGTLTQVKDGQLSGSANLTGTYSGMAVSATAAGTLLRVTR